MHFFIVVVRINLFELYYVAVQLSLVWQIPLITSPVLQARQVGFNPYYKEQLVQPLIYSEQFLHWISEPFFQ